MTQQIETILVTPKPFVKWAGGKRQLLSTLNKHIPRSFDVYFEPFLGGGALLFHILLDKPHIPCIVSDLNADLILSYITIRDDLNSLIASLKIHSKNYNKDSMSYYYKIRNSNPRGSVEKTSRLIFLNRTCFNGLYRVNSKGKFNVPLGKYVNPNIVNEDNLRAVSHILQSRKVYMSCRDFGSILDDAKKDNFIYFDPPYQPISKTSAFTSYTNKTFGLKDLKKLVDLCYDLDSKGCKVLLSNANSEIVMNHFDKSWEITKIDANRAINSNSRKRSGHSELLIKNY